VRVDLPAVRVDEDHGRRPLGVVPLEILEDGAHALDVLPADAEIEVSVLASLLPE
jgi:hypothetical protein